MQADKELVEAALCGEQCAFATLVERYERPVRSVAIAVLHDVDAAHDVAQDTFLMAFEKLPSLSNRSAFGPWVLKIAQRFAYRAARARTRSRPLTEMQEPSCTSTNGKLDVQLEGLLQAVVRLPRQERVVVMLKYFDNQPVDAVAKITGRSVGTVTKQLSRARSRLKRWLGESP